jgi:UDPglucose 6-dehydrogenase
VYVNGERVENLKEGIVPIYEPGLAPLVQRNFASGRLRLTTDAKRGVTQGYIQFITGSTPSDEDGSADL